MSLLTSILVLSQMLAVAIALTFSVTSYRAYDRTRDPTYHYTIVGFAMFGLGLGLQSYTLYTLPVKLTEIEILQSAVFAIGFGILYLSITGKQRGIRR